MRLSVSANSIFSDSMSLIELKITVICSTGLICFVSQLFSISVSSSYFLSKSSSDLLAFEDTSFFAGYTVSKLFYENDKKNLIAESKIFFRYNGYKMDNAHSDVVSFY